MTEIPLPTPATRGALTLRGIRKEYGDGVAVAGVDLDVAAGEFLAVLGPSGCGKSTVLGIIGGFVSADEGDVVVDGIDVGGLTPEKRPTAMVFQNLALFPHLTVAGNIAFGMRRAGMSRAARSRRVAELIEQVRLQGLAGRRVGELSGGQRQRVAIARALAVEPAILLLDEPLSALDAQLRAAMQHELRQLQRRTGATFVYVTHDQNEAMSMADRIMIMDGGRVEQIGTPAEVYEHPRTDFVARFLGDANVLRADRCAADSGLLRTLQAAAPSADGCWVVRPEHIRLEPSAGDGGIGGVVADAVFFGRYRRYEVTIDGIAQRVVVTRAADERAFEVGASVDLRVDAGRVVPIGLPS